MKDSVKLAATMGIHLFLVKTIREAEYDDDIRYIHLPEWDSDRYAGDTVFNIEMEKTWNHDLWRPIDLDKARDWIKAHIEVPNRLLLAMEMMETDHTIWFKTSW